MRRPVWIKPPWAALDDERVLCCAVAEKGMLQGLCESLRARRYSAGSQCSTTSTQFFEEQAFTGDHTSLSHNKEGRCHLIGRRV